MWPRIFGLVGLLTIICILAVILSKGYESSIEEKVEKIDGEVISIEGRSMYIGPFRYKTKEQHVYRFKYEHDGETKVGWVRFGPFRDDWIMDYED